MMGLIKRIFSFKNKDVVLPLFNSFVRPQQTRQFLHYVTNPTRKDCHIYIYSLLKTPIKRKTDRVLVKYLTVLPTWIRRTTKLFEIDDSTRTINNGAKLKCRQVHLDCTEFFLTDALVRDWNKLPPSVVQCNSIASFKNNLDRTLGFMCIAVWRYLNKKIKKIIKSHRCHHFVLPYGDT